jgi:hypothetical protein
MATGGQELFDDPIAQALLASNVPARLAYTWTDGTPRVASLWFHWNGTHLVMCTFEGAPKLKALHTGDRVAITIDTNAPPNHVLSIRGSAAVTQVEGVVEDYAAAAARYLGSAQADGYIRSLPHNVPMARIAVQPEHVVLLDFETRFPSALSALGLAP